MTDAVIVFLKNLTIGRVKTRLAATIGDQKALAVYKQLVAYTLEQVSSPEQETLLYFSDNLHTDLPKIQPSFSIRLQEGNDLGERMSNAFKEVFQTANRKVLIIGTDCPGLDSSVIEHAFHTLDTHQVVIGPAIDGGYYLLGMNEFHGCLFEDIPWSTSHVLELTLDKCAMHKLRYKLLEKRSDIDDEQDLNSWNEAQIKRYQ